MTIMDYLIRKKWRVNIIYTNSEILIESSSISKVNGLEIVDLLFQDCQTMIFSQYVDTRYWKINIKRELISELEEKYSAETYISTYYTDFRTPNNGSTTFVLNVTGKLDPEMLSLTTNFGTSNIPCIFYGVKHRLINWKKDLLRWNRIVLRWFNLELEKEGALAELVNQIGYLVINIDGRLVFVCTQIEHLNKLFMILRQKSKQHNRSIKLILKSGLREDY